jgi:6-phosphogluconolactonase (cycloisomerase 2 family)
VYLADQAKGTLVPFSVDRSNGVLSRIENSEIDVGNVDRLTTTQSGDFLYAAVDTGVRGFKIDTATGKLVEVPGSPYAVDYSRNTMVTHPTEAHLYVLSCDWGRGCDGEPRWLYFSIDAVSGSLTPAGASATVESAYAGGEASIDPTGRFLYTGYQVDYGTGQHEVRTIEQGTGEVSSDAHYGRGAYLQFSKTGEFKYSREIPWDDVWSSILSIKVDPVTGGDLELVDEIPYTGDPQNPEVGALTVDPDGAYGYAMWGGVVKLDTTTGKFLSVDRSFDSLGHVVVLTLR